MTAHNLKIKQTAIDSLRQHPNNPRNGDVDLIAESLETNGQYKPIVTASDGTILAGNHTYQAALSLGWDKLATVTIDVESDSPEATKIMLADNRTSDVGNYDDSLLLSILESLDDELLGTGYDADSLDRLQRLNQALNHGRLNVDDEWVGMPDYAGESRLSAFKTIVHFQNEADADAFFEMIKRPKAQSVYWPEPWDEIQRSHTSAEGVRVVADA